MRTAWHTDCGVNKGHLENMHNVSPLLSENQGERRKWPRLSAFLEGTCGSPEVINHFGKTDTHMTSPVNSRDLEGPVGGATGFKELLLLWEDK